MRARRGQLHLLAARTVATLTTPGRHADGGCLYLVVSKSGAKRWVFFWMRQGRQREAGLGSCTVVTLAQARQKAADARALLAQGLDPLEARKTQRVTRTRTRTFAECAVELVASKRASWRSAKHAKEWATTLAQHCAGIGKCPVAEIDTPAVLKVLQPLYERIPTTAERLRGRIEAVLDYAKALGLRTGENPARYRGNLDYVLPQCPKVAQKHLASLPYAQLPMFMVSLQARQSTPAMALRFLILTAARLGEVLRADWAEIDWETRIWSLPAMRMKSGREHRQPLSASALAILQAMAARRTSNIIFPGCTGKAPMAMGMLGSLVPSGFTAHGMRSAFRDWSAEQTDFPREICEQALAHATGNAVEQAYRRSDLLEKRRALMNQWALFLSGMSAPLTVSLTSSDVYR